MKLVLLPGLDGTGQLFKPLVQLLPPLLSPVVISYPNDKWQSYRQLVEFVQQQVPVSEDYVLLAESFSGPVAIGLSAANPANLKALVLSATFVSNPAPLPQMMSFLFCRPFFVLEPPQFVVSHYLLGEQPPVELVESFRRAKRSVRPDVLAFRMRTVISADARRAFAACNLPILYLRPRQDRLVKIRSLLQMQKIKPEMTVVEIEGHHFLLQRKPAECIEAITHYLGHALIS